MPKENKLFLQFYKKYKNKIFTYFLYRLNFNRDFAEDMTSEVFLKALEHFDDFDASRSFQSWIYAIAKNHLINYYRIANREVELIQAENISDRFEEKFIANLELRKTIEKIYCLDDYCREVLLLRFVDGLDNKEIADVLNKDEGAVRTQISRAMKIFKKN